jgi:4-carboxymuconolactone decarboxylase
MIMKKGKTPNDDSPGEIMYDRVLHKKTVEKESDSLVGLREFTVNHLFANIWTRSGNEPGKISLRERRLITIALLAAQGFENQLKKHARGAFFDKIREDELIEVMIHVALFAGWPAGTSGQEAIQATYKDFLAEYAKQHPGK